MRIIRMITCLCALAIILYLPVAASADDSPEEKIYNRADLGKIEENLPDELTENSLMDGLDPRSGDYGSAIFSKLAAMLGTGIGDSISFFAGIVTLAVLSALLRSVGENMSGSGVRMAFEYISVLVLSLYSYNCVSKLFEIAAAYLHSVTVYVSAVMPSLSVLTALGGGNASAFVQNAGTASAIAILEAVVSGVLSPLIRFSFAFAMVNGVSGVPLSGFARGIRRTVTVGISLVMTVLSIVLYFQNSFAIAADGIAVKAVRFASTSFIPVIGSMIGEAVGALGGSVMFLKSSAGLFCIAAVLFLTAMPVIRLTVHKIIFGGAALVCDLLGMSAQGTLLREIKETLNILLVICIAAGVFFIFALTVFVKTGTVI